MLAGVAYQEVTYPFLSEGATEAGALGAPTVTLGVGVCLAGSTAVAAYLFLKSDAIFQIGFIR